MTLTVEHRTPLLISAAVLALALRPVGWGASIVTIAAGVLGAGARIEANDEARTVAWLAVVALGAGAFVVVRLQPGVVPLRTTALGVAASVVAAIAEELFFRRLLYARLERWGVAAAIAGSAMLFAGVHVPAYGLPALPVDLAAGLLFGWQRWASGTWTAPAVTHVAANLIQVVR